MGQKFSLNFGAVEVEVEMGSVTEEEAPAEGAEADTVFTHMQLLFSLVRRRLS